MYKIVFNTVWGIKNKTKETQKAIEKTHKTNRKRQQHHKHTIILILHFGLSKKNDY